MRISVTKKDGTVITDFEITDNEKIAKGMISDDADLYIDGIKIESNRNRVVESLADTVDLMTSLSWKDRFLAEYAQTKWRYERLHRMIIVREADKIGFKTPIPLESWKRQAECMGGYLHELEKQALIHGIELPEVKV